MYKNILLLVCMSFMFFSCKKDMKDYLTRNWIVNSIELDGVNYGTSIMSLNLLNLDADNTGSIPWVNSLDTIPTIKGKARDLKWNLISSNTKECYIEIYDSKVDYFNDTFKVVIVNEDNFLGQFVSKRVKLDCQGVSNLGLVIE